MMRKNGFLCYAYRSGQSPSRRYVEELQRHLNVIELPHEHRARCDQDLKSGDDWRTEIHNALDAAAYAVLFVNVEFLNSRFITEVELPQLLDAKGGGHKGGGLGSQHDVAIQDLTPALL